MAEPAPTQVVSDAELQQMESAPSANVMVKDGKGYLVDPTGRHAIVPTEQVSALLAKGYQPMGESAAYETTWEGHGAAGSFLSHGINELMPGVAGQGMLGGMMLRRSEREHPTASGAGKLAGAVGGLVAPVGPLGAAAKGARMVGQAAGRGAVGMLGGKAGAQIAQQMPGVASRASKVKGALVRSGAAEKVAGWGAQGALEGAAVGAGAAAAKAGVHPETTVNDGIASVITGAAFGGAGGALLGGLGAGLTARAAGKAAKQQAAANTALRTSLDKATKKIVDQRDKVRADLGKHWMPTQGGWTPPSNMALANAMRGKAAALTKTTDDELRRALVRSDSWERRALELSQKSTGKQKSAAREAAALRDKADTQAMYLEHAPKSRQGGVSALRIEAKEVIGKAKAEAGAVQPTVDFLRKQAKVTVDQAKKARSQMSKWLEREAARLEKQVDAVKTSSGVKVSELETVARDLQVKLSEARAATLEKFNATYAPDQTKMAGLGKWAAESMIARAGVGMVAGGPSGALVGALIGRKPVEIAAQVAMSVGKKAGRGARLVGKQAGVRAVAKVAALRGLSAPKDRDEMFQSVLAATDADIAERAEQAADQTALVWGLDEATKRDAVQRNVDAFGFISQKAKELSR